MERENVVGSLIRRLITEHDRDGCGKTPAGGFCLHYRASLLAYFAHIMMVHPEQLVGEVKTQLEEYERNCPHCQDPRASEETPK